MKKISFILIGAVLLIVGLNTRCTKVNTDQPCGTHGNNQQLFRDGDNNSCYYIDQSTHKNVYVDKSECTCLVP
jgi:hypothetical protein